MKTKITLLAAAFAASTASHAALVLGWEKSQGVGPLTNANTASPTMGDGTAESADAMGIYASFPSISLANIGDQITLTTTVTLAGIVNNSPNHFRWSLYDVAGSPNLNGWLGYITGNATAAAGSQLHERINPNTGLVMSTAAGVATLRNTSVPAGAGNNFNSSTYDLVYAFQRTDTGLTISSSFIRTSDSVQFGFHNWTDDSPETFTFNRVGFLASGVLDADQVQFSNVDVSFIPEPSAALLGALGALCLLRRRRA